MNLCTLTGFLIFFMPNRTEQLSIFTNLEQSTDARMHLAEATAGCGSMSMHDLNNASSRNPHVCEPRPQLKKRRITTREK